MTKTMKKRIDLLTDVQEYIIKTSESIDSCIAMDLCVRVQELKDEIYGGDVTEFEKGEEIED